MKRRDLSSSKCPQEWTNGQSRKDISYIQTNIYIVALLCVHTYYIYDHLDRNLSNIGTLLTPYAARLHPFTVIAIRIIQVFNINILVKDERQA